MPSRRRKPVIMDLTPESAEAQLQAPEFEEIFNFVDESPVEEPIEMIVPEKAEQPPQTVEVEEVLLPVTQQRHNYRKVALPRKELNTIRLRNVPRFS